MEFDAVEGQKKSTKKANKRKCWVGNFKISGGGGKMPPPPLEVKIGEGFTPLLGLIFDYLFFIEIGRLGL